MPHPDTVQSVVVEGDKEARISEHRRLTEEILEKDDEP